MSRRGTSHRLRGAAQWTTQRTALVGLGGAAILLACSLVVASHLPFLAPNGSARSNAGGGCPSSNAISNFLNDSNVSATFTLDGSGNVATYLFSSANESPASGVPGLIQYCVYPSGSLPGNASAVAKGADGSSFTVAFGTHQGFFAYGRSNGNPTNLPLDGAQNVTIGNATWSAGAPTTQAILLHINDAYVCNVLYGGNPGTCFVYPGPASSRCSAPGVAPSAVRIPLSVPTKGLPVGATLSAQYEVAVSNYASGDLGAVVHVPSANVHFPLSPSGNLSMFVLPKVVTISGSGWSSPLGAQLTAGSATTFDATKSAWISTANLAVMVDGGLANLTLEVRWGWTVNVSGTLTTLWSVPSGSAVAPNYPSVFTPAPYVHVLSMSNTTLSSGAYFSLVLGGAVNATEFRTLVETPMGKELHCQVQQNPHSGVAHFAVGIPMTYADSTALPPGKYLVHVHDAMGAIVLGVPVTVV